MNREQLAILECNLHAGEPITHVCLLPECKEKGLLCYLCTLENHDLHTCFEFKIMVNRIIKGMEPSKSLLSGYSALIDKQFMVFEDKLSKLQNKLNLYEQIRIQLGKYRKHFLGEAMKIFEVLKGFEKVLQAEGVIFRQLITEYLIENYEKYFQSSETPKKEERQLSVCQQYLQSKLYTLKGISSFLDKSTHSIQDAEILDLLKISEHQGTKTFIPFFVDDLKGEGMEIQEGGKKCTMKTHSAQRLVVMSPSLQKNVQKKRWQMKVVKMASWVGLGVCNLESIKKANFMFNYSSTNHGSYLISSNGYSWSGYQPEFNSKFESFAFGTGDCISLTFDPRERTIQFQKESDQSKYQLSLPPKSDDPLHPCINLTGVGDSVEVII